MTEIEGDRANEVYQQCDTIIVAVVRAMTADLTDEQKEYVLTKLSDEFQFWRCE